MILSTNSTKAIATHNSYHDAYGISGYRDPPIVVGTTPDYVARISDNYPEATIFLLDPRFKRDPFIERVEPSSLLFTSLENPDEALGVLQTYLTDNRLSPRAFACFDCEYLILAGKLAHRLDIPFPSTDAIARTRNKFKARRVWRRAGLRSPTAVLASGLAETLEFYFQVKRDIVLKPVSGSGSELLFICRSEHDIMESVLILEEQLPKRRAHPLFRPVENSFSKVDPIDPCRSWIVEEFVTGPEFSCDFALWDNKIFMIRETGKVKASDQTFGTVSAYTLPPIYPKGFSVERLHRALETASRALGFRWGYFMVDFIVDQGEPVIIEMAPRPGGDSIPDLVTTATGCDILGIYLDMMAGKSPPPNLMDRVDRSFASINLFASEEGFITDLDASGVISCPRVEALYLKKQVGDKITLPPHDYDNRILGYCIISLEPYCDLVSIQRELAKLLKVSIDPRTVRNRCYERKKRVTRRHDS
jgi:biotin carboxylase